MRNCCVSVKYYRPAIHICRTRPVLNYTSPSICVMSNISKVDIPSNISAHAQLLKMFHVTEYAPAKTREYPSDIIIHHPIIKTVCGAKKYLKDNYHNSPHLMQKYAWILFWRIITTLAPHMMQKYAWILDFGHYLFLKAHSFRQATLTENCLLLGTDQIRGEI